MSGSGHAKSGVNVENIIRRSVNEQTLSEESSLSSHNQLSTGLDSPVKQHLSLHELSMCSTNAHTDTHADLRPSLNPPQSNQPSAFA